MSFEKPNLNNVDTTTPQRETIEPTTLAKRMEKMVSLLFRAETIGLENIKGIPPEKHIIFLPTHMSDYDLPIAIGALATLADSNLDDVVLVERLKKLKVVEASTHENFKQGSGGYIGRQIAGVENSLSVGFSNDDKGGDGNSIFDIDNFEPMKKSIENGNTLVFAAYFDPNYQGKNWRIPKRGGNGGVYLGQIIPNTVLIPVAVDIKSKPFGMKGEFGLSQLIKRPKVEVKLGKPIYPNKIEHIERFSEILDKKKKGEELTPEDRADFSRIHNALKLESDRVMSSISEMLPPEKQFHLKGKENI